RSQCPSTPPVRTGLLTVVMDPSIWIRTASIPGEMPSPTEERNRCTPGTRTPRTSGAYMSTRSPAATSTSSPRKPVSNFLLRRTEDGYEETARGPYALTARSWLELTQHHQHATQD